MDLDSYQSEALKSDHTGKSTVALYGLAGEIGGLFSLFKKRLRDRQASDQFKADLSEELGDILWYVANLASSNNIQLSSIAQTNLEKVSLLFSRAEAPFFDSEHPQNARLPDHLKALFSIDPNTGKALLSIDGNMVGDPLSDNVLNEDDYRFHDAFHLAFLTHLHWSPVLRRLLKRKRKSTPNIDEGQDGARAAIVEEAAIGIVFSFAEQNGFFEDKRSIPLGLIKLLQRLTSKYEVHSCSASQWRDAIFDGCHAFSKLSANKGGMVFVDTIDRHLEYHPPVSNDEKAIARHA